MGARHELVDTVTEVRLSVVAEAAANHSSVIRVERTACAGEKKRSYRPGDSGAQAIAKENAPRRWPENLNRPPKP
jgi:hypothetical protein